MLSPVRAQGIYAGNSHCRCGVTRKWSQVSVSSLSPHFCSYVGSPRGSTVLGASVCALRGAGSLGGVSGSQRKERRGESFPLSGAWARVTLQAELRGQRGLADLGTCRKEAPEQGRHWGAQWSQGLPDRRGGPGGPSLTRVLPGWTLPD